MEKEMKIIPPEGYEIDKENSTFECIKFKPIYRITYTNVCARIFSSTYHYITSDGNIYETYLSYTKYTPNTAPCRKQLEKILAINQLFNIAKYYNGDWEPDWSRKDTVKYYIKCYKGEYSIDILHFTNLGIAIFRNKEDAQEVIDNPNFRDILDTIFK